MFTSLHFYGRAKMESLMDTPALWPWVVYCGAVMVVVAGMVLTSYVLGERHRGTAAGEPYESGIVSTGSARLRMSVKFYLVAVFFVIFDLESVFIFAWAICCRQAGWAGYVEILVFIAILVAALAYLWREGALDWAPGRKLDQPRQPGGDGS
jgi:NADH-quinone oxidoreductase subunit A